MEALLYLPPALGCGLMMVVIMLFMGRLVAPPRNGQGASDTGDELTSLRVEVARLRSSATTGDRVDG